MVTVCLIAYRHAHMYQLSISAVLLFAIQKIIKFVVGRKRALLSWIYRNSQNPVTITVRWSTYKYNQERIMT